jgi:hypothetical protein
MTYNFDSELATEYGVNEAIFIHNIFFWIRQNEANEKHFYKGRYWTYNTKAAFAELFPFWSYSQVKNIIKKLVDFEVLIIDNFNEKSWDKTNWYSLSDEVVNFYKTSSKVSKNALAKNSQSSGENSPMERSNLADGVAKISQSIIGTDNKPYSKTQIEGSLAFFENNFPERFERLMMQFKNQISDYVMFAQMFDATVQQEGLKYEADVLEGRFKKYAWNWIRNQSKGRVIEMNTDTPTKKIGALQ